MKATGFLAAAIFAGLFAGMGSVRALEILPARPIAPPGYVCQWVPPVYRTVADSVWTPESVSMVPEWVEVSPGVIEQAWRQVVTPGHWTRTTRQVLVAEGHWELVAVAPPFVVPPPVVVAPPVVITPGPVWTTSPGTVGVDGYGSGGGEDLSKFSGLSDWPKDK